MDFFNIPLHRWFAINNRDLPWRNTCDPYQIWISEIILQQTRIDQGLVYYNRFIEEFPVLSSLANATEDQVLKLWQGLGYYSRARNLHYTARWIEQNCNGIFPDNYHDILKLKGIGEYTAAAIASISFKQEYPAIDGNVYRVLSRFFGIDDPIDTGKGRKIFTHLAGELIKRTDPGMHNQALMEFGALQCVPQNPNCLVCPLNLKCFALANKKISELPVKQNKTKQRNRYFNYLVFSSSNSIWIKKRMENDIWKGLFEFPMIETDQKTEIEHVLSGQDMEKIRQQAQITIEEVSDWQLHLLSHQRIYYRFIQLEYHSEFCMPQHTIKVNKKDIFNFAVPKLLETYLSKHL
jgi:A/G-specific adenine glycosylase